MARKPKVFEPSINLPISAGTALVGKQCFVEVTIQVEGEGGRLEERTAFLDIDYTLKFLGDLAIAAETCRKVEKK